ncbi:MAG TPA: cytochrome c [Gemmatimonadaceae bacterium]|nr:cytochrome c [Gemmatimonadaceae bacterium]
MNRSRLVQRVAIACAITEFTVSCGRGTEAHADFERMRAQQRYDSYASSAFFPDGKTMRTPPIGTVSREEAVLGDSVATGKRGGVFVANIPIPISPELARKARTDFKVYCATCHGEQGSGGGLVGSNLEVAPPSLTAPGVRGMSGGELFETITQGRGAMPAYGWALPPVERWAVIAYLRSLQKSE